MRHLRSTDPRKTFSIVGLVFAGVAVVLLVVALVVNFAAGRAEERRSAVADGVVIDYDVSRSDDSDTYCPIVQFAVDGTDYTVRSGICTGSRPTIGEAREVAYNPEDPHDAALAGWATRWLAVAICGGLGVAFGLVSGILLVVRRRMPTRSDVPAETYPTQAPVLPFNPGGDAPVVSDAPVALPSFARPDFPAAAPGTGYDAGAVDLFVRRVEDLYADLGAGRTSGTTSQQLSELVLSTAAAGRPAYDATSVDLFRQAALEELRRYGR